MKTFADELRELLNRHSKENGSDTPDFVLRKYLVGCLAVFDEAVRGREEHYGRRESRAERCRRTGIPVPTESIDPPVAGIPPAPLYIDREVE